MDALKNKFRSDELDWNAIRAIIENDVKDVNDMKVIDESGRTLIHRAVMCKSLESTELMNLVTFLYNKWPESLMEKSFNGSTPLHEACHFSKDTDLIRFLILKCPEALREKGYRESLPLHDACYNEILNEPLVVIRELVEAWPDSIKEVDEDGWTPLHCAACGFAELSVLQYLTEEYPEALRLKEINGALPIHQACRCNGDLAKIQYLATRNDAEDTLLEIDEMEMTPLHHNCTDDKDIAITEFLIELRPKALTMKDFKGFTPLHRSCFFNLPDNTVKYVVTKCPQPFLWKDNNGKTPLELLREPNKYVDADDKKMVNTTLVRWFESNRPRIEANIIFLDLLRFCTPL